jgi:P27 family predicted phage terminase small subunit
MTKTGSLPAPRGLSPSAVRIWRRVTGTYHFENEPASQLLLETALQAHDRMHQARDLIAVQGLTIMNRYSNYVPNPLLAIEDKSRRAMLQAMQQLGLEPQKLEEKP